VAEKEATARIKINKLLEESGWRFFDSKDGKANVDALVKSHKLPN
jgi:type I restriction enzyme R subunit